MTGDDLTAEPAPIDPRAGAGLLDTGGSFFDDLAAGVHKGDWDAIALSVDGISLGLDLLAAALNPLGELIKAGVGWLMEHFWPLREALEVLTGDPKQVQAVSETWRNISREFAEAADAYRAEVGTITSWHGVAAANYRAAAEDYIGALAGVAVETEHTADGVMIAGMMVGTVRGVIFDMIASFISRVISEALIAMASAPFTLGTSVEMFIASMTADLGMLLGRIGKKMSKLLYAIRNFIQRFLGKSAKLRQVAKDLGDRAQNLHNWGHTREVRGWQKQPGVPEAGPGRTYDDTFGPRQRTPLGKLSEHKATRVVDEGTKSIKDALNPPDDQDQ
jgi:methyl-accepting chemotaxis protein